MNVTNTIVLVTLFALMVVGVVGLMVIINSKEKKIETITVLSKKNLTDQHFLNYFSLFVLLALAFDLSKVCFVCVFVAILIFIGIVYVKNNIFYINPLLNIMGYSFYDITYKDKSDNVKEMRIFYKGEIEIDRQKYSLNISARNLNFLEKIKK
jgi:fatty-acid desaturase